MRKDSSAARGLCSFGLMDSCCLFAGHDGPHRLNSTRKDAKLDTLQENLDMAIGVLKLLVTSFSERGYADFISVVRGREVLQVIDATPTPPESRDE